jgi:hypothetical protein
MTEDTMDSGEKSIKLAMSTLVATIATIVVVIAICLLMFVIDKNSSKSESKVSLERVNECLEMNGKPIVVPQAEVHVYHGCIIGA